ncbi:hypothetical protein, partial [Mycolicibacterium chubuense]
GVDRGRAARSSESWVARRRTSWRSCSESASPPGSECF